MKMYLLVLPVIMFACGCGKHLTKLEQTALQLKPGMNKSEVKQLFTGFDSWETNEVFGVRLALMTKSFSTNNMSSSLVTYTPKGFFSPFEYCAIYFDTNDVTICYDYHLNN
jgi:hypothetical protein